MYPLNAILISSNETLIPQVRRELSNAEVHLEGVFPDTDHATHALGSSSAQKRLLILHMDTVGKLASLGRLTSMLPGWPVVALVEGYDPKSSAGEVVVGIMRTGASEILSLPIRPEEFQAATDRIAAQFVYSLRDTKVIAVGGVTGGSGSTTISLNLAFEIAHRHHLRCVLVDLSLRMGKVALYLNIEPTHTILDLLRDSNGVDTSLTHRALIKVADNFQILAGPHKLVAPRVIQARDILRLIDTLKQIVDVVVLDVPCTYDEIYFETLAAASHAILIGEQTLPSIRALKMVREAIDRPGGTEHLVVNRFDPRNKGFELSRLLKPLGVSTLHPVACDEPGMSVAMEKACTLRFGSPRSPALADIVAVADAVLALDAPSKLKPAGLFRRLGRALANS